MSSTPPDYHPTLLQALTQIITRLTSALTLLPMHPRTTPHLLRAPMRDSISQWLACAQIAYKLRLHQDFPDEVDLTGLIVVMNDGPTNGSEETDWSTVSDREWKAEVEELRDLADSWVLILDEFGRGLMEVADGVGVLFF
ncbi:hypothetical protein L873DRAFT_1344895 [Choiromyces venosus 120613-1]|uniref:Uncharacterized protein n=1 Tax=Choiromyces venosus 120613-1 TaxID=1336337 RepID=A0A3N4K491_9PEZI|nr:hypothetical protein L873DRAFT_1344895 [Choiromyces venosus 120613-1]